MKSNRILSGMSRLARWLVLAATVGLASCGGSSGNPDPVPPPPPPPPVVIDGEKAIPVTGGTVAIESAGSPILGAKVEIGAETLVDTTETITITYEDALPAALNADALALGGKQISKVLVLKRTGVIDFGKAVSVTMPFDKAALGADAVPIVVTWDESISAYSPVTIRALDRDKGTVTFMTAHFSKFVVLVLDKLFGLTPPDPATLTYGVGFVPADDGFFDRNFGSYDSPGGNCFGMAGYAAWYHASKKASKGAGLGSLYKEGDVVLEEDDQTARELITRAYQAGEQKGHLKALDWINDMSFLTREIGERFIAYQILAHLVVTKQAQILAMGVGGSPSWSKGHAVTVYGYDGARKVFQFYDNNFPAEVVELPWDPIAGFGNYSIKGITWDRFAFASFNQAYSPATLEALFNGAESGWASSHFPKISIASPTEHATAKNTYEVATDENVAITGTVPRAADADNPTAQRYMHVYLNGTKFGSTIPVGNSDNSFTVSIAKLPVASGTDVMLLVSEKPDSWAGVFTAFKQFKVRVENQFFFKNFGLEAGDFSDWISERHVWGGGDSVTPSDKSTVVASGGFDPIATDLPTTLFGNFAARINNEDNNYHISTLTQSAVVPNAVNPVVRFYWAAVLEDPSHSPEDQPYVDVVVMNDTKGIELYRKRFFTNDPSYSGWKEYLGGSWKSIPWQLVELPVAAYVGDTLTLKVEAADCALGGHGGYAYIDAEE